MLKHIPFLAYKAFAHATVAAMLVQEQKNFKYILLKGTPAWPQDFLFPAGNPGSANALF
jgi:hypothetical protein